METPSKGELISIVGRYAYLKALDQHWPELIHALHRDVAPLYRPALGGSPKKPFVTRDKWERLCNDRDRVALREKLTYWAEHYSLKDHWILDAALQTMCYQHDPKEEKPLPQPWIWVYVAESHDIYGDPFVPKFENNLWCPPAQETWEDFSGRMRSQFLKQLSAYRNEAKKRYAVGKTDIDVEATRTVLYQQGKRAHELVGDLKAYEDPEQAIYK